MRRLHFVPTAVFLLLSLCHRSVWAESLSVESQANLNQLTVGQSFAVEVHLAGLPSGESLDLLTMALTFDDALLSATSSVAGEIVPNPLHEAEDLLAFLDPGFVDVAFSTFSAQSSGRIAENGTFVTVHLTARAIGSGRITLQEISATRFNSVDPDIPLEVAIEPSPGLNFSIVPEPSSLMAMFLLLFASIPRLRHSYTGSMV